jgi:hypothetical protein
LPTFEIPEQEVSMRRHLGVALIAVALAATPPLWGQQSSTVGTFELRPIVGAFVPTGAMRNDFRDAMLVGMQGGFEFSPNLHLLLGGFWSRNDTHASVIGSQHADLWQFDAGAEANLIKPMGRDWFFRPYVGGGLGMRTYDYSAMDGTNRCLAGYASVGAEAQRFVGALRFEARDNVTCYESPATGVKRTRNDLGLMLGFVYHVR